MYHTITRKLGRAQRRGVALPYSEQLPDTGPWRSLSRCHDRVTTLKTGAPNRVIFVDSFAGLGKDNTGGLPRGEELPLSLR